jgi:hypothetical protein
VGGAGVELGLVGLIAGDRTDPAVRYCLHCDERGLQAHEDYQSTGLITLEFNSFYIRLGTNKLPGTVELRCQHAWHC